MHPVIQHPVREIRTPNENAKICEVYHNGYEYMVLIKVRKKTLSIPLRHLLMELTRDIPSEALHLT